MLFIVFFKPIPIYIYFKVFVALPLEVYFLKILSGPDDDKELEHNSAFKPVYFGQYSAFLPKVNHKIFVLITDLAELNIFLIHYRTSLISSLRSSIVIN